MDEQTPGTEVPDPYFSRIRAADLPPEAVVSREIRDELAKVDEGIQNKGLKILGLLTAMLPVGTYGVIQLEQQIVELRREVAQLRQEVRELRGY